MAADGLVRDRDEMDPGERRPERLEMDPAEIGPDSAEMAPGDGVFDSSEIAARPGSRSRSLGSPEPIGPNASKISSAASPNPYGGRTLTAQAVIAASVKPAACSFFTALCALSALP